MATCSLALNPAQIGSAPEPRIDTAELALLRRAQKGDEQAFQEIVERYKKKVFSVIRSILPRSNDIEDVAQQTFVKAYFALERFELRCSLGTWICRIAVNEALDYLRKRSVRPVVYECDLGEEDACRLDRRNVGVQPAPMDDVVAQRDLLLRLLSRMSPADRDLLLLRELEGYSVEELARLTGISANTLKVRLFRARRRLIRAARMKYGLTPAAA